MITSNCRQFDEINQGQSLSRQDGILQIQSESNNDDNNKFYATSSRPNPLKRYDTTNMMTIMKDCYVVNDLYRSCVESSDTKSTFCSAVVTSYLKCSTSKK